MITLGRGTASEETLDLLGLEKTEKAVLFSVIENEIIKSIITEAGLNTKAKSIVFSLPVASADGLWIFNQDN